MSSDPCADDLEGEGGDGAGTGGPGAGGPGDIDGSGPSGTGGVDPDEESSEAPYIAGLADGNNNTGTGQTPPSQTGEDGGVPIPEDLQGIDLQQYGYDPTRPLTEAQLAAIIDQIREARIQEAIRRADSGLGPPEGLWGDISFDVMRRMNPSVGVAEDRQKLLNAENQKFVAGTGIALQSAAPFVEILDGKNTTWQRSTWFFNDSALIGATRGPEDMIERTPYEFNRSGNFFKTPNTWYNFHPKIRAQQPRPIPPSVALMYLALEDRANTGRGTTQANKGSIKLLRDERWIPIVDPVRLLSNKMWINTDHLDGPSMFWRDAKKLGVSVGSVNQRTNRRDNTSGASTEMKRFHKNKSKSLYFVNKERPEAISHEGATTEPIGVFMSIHSDISQDGPHGFSKTADPNNSTRIANFNLLTDSWSPGGGILERTNNISEGVNILHPVFWRNMNSCQTDYGRMNKLGSTIKYELYSLNTRQQRQATMSDRNRTIWSWPHYLYGYVGSKEYAVLKDPQKYENIGFKNWYGNTANPFTRPVPDTRDVEANLTGDARATIRVKYTLSEFGEGEPIITNHPNQQNVIADDDLYLRYAWHRDLNMNMFPVFPFWGDRFDFGAQNRPNYEGIKNYYQVPPPTVGKFVFEDYCTNVPDTLLAEEKRTSGFGDSFIGNPASVSIKPVYNYYDCLYERYFADPVWGLPEVELPSPYLKDYKTVIENMTKEGNSIIDSDAYRRLLLLRFTMMASVKDRGDLVLTKGSEVLNQSADDVYSEKEIERARRDAQSYRAYNLLESTSPYGQKRFYETVLSLTDEQKSPKEIRSMAYFMKDVYGFNLAPASTEADRLYSGLGIDSAMYDDIRREYSYDPENNSHYSRQYSDHPNFTRDFFLASLSSDEMEEIYERRFLNQMFVEFEIDSLEKSQIAEALIFNGDDTVLQRLFTAINPMASVGYFNGERVKNGIYNANNLSDDESWRYTRPSDLARARQESRSEYAREEQFQRDDIQQFERTKTTYSFVKQASINETWDYKYENPTDRVSENVLSGMSSNNLTDYSDNYPIYPPGFSQREHEFYNVIDFASWYDVVMKEIASSDSAPLKKFESIFKLLKIRMNLNRIINDKARSWKQIMDGMPAASEVIGYMISKSKVKSDGSLDHISNFWVMGKNDKDVQKFVDSQIKYGTVYQYEVHQIVAIVGNNYSYLDPFGDGGQRERVYDWDTTSGDFTEGVFPFGIVNMPCLKIATLPSVTKRVAVADRPPIYPNVDIIPFKNEPRKIMFNLSGNSGTTRSKPVFLEADDVAQFYVSLLNQGVDETFFKTYDRVTADTHTDGVKHTWSEYFKTNPQEIGNALLEFKSDDPATVFEAFRIDTYPSSFKDFRGNMIKKIDSSATNTSFVDNILPNKKYYYVFRTEDVHGHVSNPTHVYEVELITMNNAIRPNIKIVEPKDLVQEKGELGKSSTKLRQFISLRPALHQKKINLPTAGTYGDSIIDEGTNLVNTFNPRLGPESSVFGKKFKMRIKSKRTGKEIDINMRFVLKKRDKREQNSDESPETLC